MWWVWIIVGVAAVLAVVFLITRGRPSPNHQTLQDHRRDDRGFTNPTDPRAGGRPRSS